MDSSLSALLAVRNVQCTLRSTVLEILELMSELTSRFELVLADDCSTDATIEVADELAAVFPQLYVLRHETPRGYWDSIRSAFGRSLGEWVILPEEDRVVAWQQIGRMWMLTSEYDLVVGRAGECDQGRVATPIGLPNAGFLLGRRRVFAEAWDSLGDWSAFSTRLEVLGIRWREVTLSLPAWHRWQLPFSVWSRVADAAESIHRAGRRDRAEVVPGKPIFWETPGEKTPSLSGQHLFPAADLIK